MNTASSFRQKAEELFQSQNDTIVQNVSEADTLKLIHELQVHQIELELQSEELHRAKELADIATQKYSDLYDFAPTGYFTLDKDVTIVDINLLAAKMLGTERSYAQNKHFGLFVSNDTKQDFNRFFESLFKNNQPEHCEIKMYVKDSLPLFVQLSGIAKKDDDKCLITAIDITASKQMEQELLLAKDQAEESDRLKTAFLQNISHEFRTPMNAIMGFSSLLSNNFNNKEKLEKFSEIINQRCYDLLDIVDEILDISKLDSGQLNIKIENYLVHELVFDLTKFFNEYQKRIEKHQVTLRWNIPNELSNTVIAIDKMKLRKIFINLISNAFKFTEKGFIDVRCTTDDYQNFKFSVSDTGIGIAREKQEIIFERFSKVDNSSTSFYGGNGLGLSIVQGLVNLFGGKIKLESELGKGSTFSFTIPNIMVQQQTFDTVVSKELSKNNFSQKTVLIVEDDVYNTDYLLEILAETGLNIMHTEYGKEAIEIAISQPIDLVLMDIRLPDMDGYEVTRQILEQKQTVKIIAQTAYASHNEKQKAIDAGCVDYISKPMKKQDLLSMIQVAFS